MSRPLGPRCRTAEAFFPLQINNSKLDGRLLARSADFNRLTPLEHPHDTIKSETPNPTQPITVHAQSSFGSDRTVSAIARFKPTKVGAPSLFDGATLNETHQKTAWSARQKIERVAAPGFGMTMGGCCPGAPILIGLHHSNTRGMPSQLKARCDLNLLAGIEDCILPFGPDLIIQQQLENHLFPGMSC